MWFCPGFNPGALVLVFWIYEASKMLLEGSETCKEVYVNALHEKEKKQKLWRQAHVKNVFS